MFLPSSTKARLLHMVVVIGPPVEVQFKGTSDQKLMLQGSVIVNCSRLITS